ncbi:hypothetical protein AXZ77_0973 [Thioclava sp. ES.031]|uniref:hypothetical protein n=1 Tax=Thioclava sp. ES.031 TaxID=1798203 RepID=UPI000BF2CE0A|nr:hypothetical protein [Thioclava sp. ES.031]PFG62395.1 hypothetical protein AXZ77_0973 [Thioclava sp. ES.031]
MGRLPGLAVIGTVVGLAGCVPQPGLQDLKRSYPDRTLYHFNSAALGGEVSYLCAPGNTPRATKARARKAHAAYEAEIQSYGDRFAETLVSALEAGTGASSAAQEVNRDSDAWAREAALKIEEQYECLPVAAPGVGISK